MAGNADLQRKLNQGIESAKAGDRATARRLLEEVVEQDDRNEMAWIWLATVAAGASQRREYLRKVLTINPRNQRAREALAALGEDPTPAASTSTASRSTLSQILAQPDATRRPENLTASPRRSGGSTGLIFVIAAVALLLAGLGIILFGGDIFNQPTPTPTNTLAPVISQDVTEEPTNTPQPQPSNTPVPIELITRSAATLPPTPTATITPTLTPTLQVTEPVALDTFEIVYVSHDAAAAEPLVLMLRANGEADSVVIFQARDIAFAADGFTFAFVRDVVSEDGSTRAPEIFISTMSNPEDARQLTSMGAADTAHPSFSPDASRLVFSSSGSGSAPDLWIVGINGGTPTALTVTQESEREPAWAPAGDRIAYTSDMSVIGSAEIFIQSVTAAGQPLGSPIQATNANRNSYSPAWSADGSTIVFASDRTGDGDIYTMDAQGNNEQLITVDDGGAEDRTPGFSPDGRWIVFTSNREDGNFQTYVTRNNGTNTRRVTFNERTDVAALFRPQRLD